MEAPQTILASTSSSPDEVIVSPGLSLLQDDHKAEEDLLKQTTSNLGIQAEVVKEMTVS